MTEPLVWIAVSAIAMLMVVAIPYASERLRRRQAKREDARFVSDIEAKRHARVLEAYLRRIHSDTMYGSEFNTLAAEGLRKAGLEP